MDRYIDRETHFSLADLGGGENFGRGRGKGKGKGKGKGAELSDFTVLHVD